MSMNRKSSCVDGRDTRQIMRKVQQSDWLKITQLIFPLCAMSIQTFLTRLFTLLSIDLKEIVLSGWCYVMKNWYSLGSPWGSVVFRCGPVSFCRPSWLIPDVWSPQIGIWFSDSIRHLLALIKNAGALVFHWTTERVFSVYSIWQSFHLTHIFILGLINLWLGIG